MLALAEEVIEMMGWMAPLQAAVLLHRGRERLVRQRTGLVNALRGHLAEFGVIAWRLRPFTFLPAS